MPMPLSATASSTQSRPSATLRHQKAIMPSSVISHVMHNRMSSIAHQPQAGATRSFGCGLPVNWNAATGVQRWCCRIIDPPPPWGPSWERVEMESALLDWNDDRLAFLRNKEIDSPRPLCCPRVPDQVNSLVRIGAERPFAYAGK